MSAEMSPGIHKRYGLQKKWGQVRHTPSRWPISDGAYVTDELDIQRKMDASRQQRWPPSTSPHLKRQRNA